MKNIIIKFGLCAIGVLGLTSLQGCYQVVMPAETKTVMKEVSIEREGTPPPGTVQYIWEEPMVDVVDVPPGLDPEGHYYRPGHQAVVEIRQGKWRHYRAADGN